MAVNGTLPFIHVEDQNGSPYVGAKLFVYEVETTTNRPIFSNPELTTVMANPLQGAIASDAAGNFPVFYMSAGLYKLRAVTSADVLIWEWDNLDTGTSAGAGALPIVNGGTGATTAAAARANLDVPSNSELADLADTIATFTASLQNLVSQPQGRLTIVSGTPIIAASGTVTSVFYTRYIGNLCPVYDGVQFNLKVFGELTLTLTANHVLNSIYDCFIINDASDGIVLVTGPAWNTITAGSGARGTGAGTSELTRVNGLWVNANAIATARNGATTYAVAANQGTYVGSIYIDGTAGQVSCQLNYGQARKWGVWNAYNRKPILLTAGDATASWSNTPTTWRQSRADAANFAMGFCGLPEETILAEFVQVISSQTNNTASSANIGVGVNSTTVLSGLQGVVNGNTNVAASIIINGCNAIAKTALVPSLGINQFNMIEQAPTGTTNNVYVGTSANMRMELSWLG